MDEKIIVTLVLHAQQKNVDIEVPLDVTAHDLVVGVNEAFALHIPVEDISRCYLAAENPIALVKGKRTLREIGLHNGTVLHLMPRSSGGKQDGGKRV